MNKFLTKIAGLTLGLAMAIGVGVAIVSKDITPVHAADPSVSFDITDIFNNGTYTLSSGNNAYCYTSVSLNSNFTMSTTGTANCGSFWERSSGSKTYEWRLYQNKSGNITITAASGYTIKTLKLTFANGNSGTLLDGTTAISSGTANNVNASSKTYTVSKTGSGTNGQIKIRGVEITYSTGSTKTLSSIAITTPPTKTSYHVGETFDATNMVVTATYSDASTGNVTSSCTYSTDPFTTTGAQNVVISYTEGGMTKTANQEVSVAARTVSGVTSSGQTDTFSSGAKFSYGGTLTASYDYGANATVTPTSFKYGASGINPTSAGTAITTDTTLSASEHDGKTIYVIYTENATTVYTSYTITVNAVADVVLNTSNKPYTSTASNNTSEQDVTLSGIEYHSYAAYIYNSYLSFNRSQSGAYLGNNTAFSNCIKKIIVNYNSGGSGYFTMYEGSSAIAETSTISPSKTGTGEVTYTFSNTKQFFKFKLTTTGTYCNINSISIYLGAIPVAKVVDSVSIATPGSVYVGKTLQLTATVIYTGGVASDHDVTWRVSSGSGATVDDTGLVTATAATATTIEAKSVGKNSSDQQVTASVTITPLANPIVSVAWDTSGAKTSYQVGDSLNIDNITATGTNASGDDDIEIELAESNFSGFDSSEPAASQTITITYLTFSTTYTISVVAAPDVYIVDSDFSSSSYSANDGNNDYDGITFNVKDSYKNSGGIQMKATTGQIHNTDPLGRYITSIEVKVKTNSVNVYLGTEELTTNSGTQTATVSSSGGATTITPNSNTYQYIRFGNGGTYVVVEYIKIWYAPFVPTVTLTGSSSYTIDEGDTGTISVSATASHFTNNSGVVFTAASGTTSILADADISVVGSTISIDKADINPGTTVVTVTGTYSAASEIANASFTIVCNAAQRNLESIAITTASSDTVFTAGDLFTITDLVVTGSFDAEPLTADVTSECTFKLWNGSAESALTPGTTALSTAGDFTIRISHASSAAAETLTYSIHVNEVPKFSVADFADLYEGAQVLIVSTQDAKAVGAYGSSIYGYESVTIDSEGKITDWGDALVFTVRVFGDRLAFEYGNNKYLGYNGSGNNAHEQSILDGNENASWTFDETGLLSSTTGRYFEYNSGSPRFACYTNSQHNVSIYISSNSIKTDALSAKTYAYKYLHLRDYLADDADGSCMKNSTNHYYTTAKSAYSNLTTDEKVEFAKLSDAVARLQAWARANSETFDPAAKTFTANSGLALLNATTIKSSSATIIIVVISAISAASIGGYFLFRKKKED